MRTGRIPEECMKTSVPGFLASSAIRPAVLSVLFLGIAGACQAQTSSAPARPAAQAAVAPLTQTVQTAAPTAPPARGTPEGIKVHGHWTIEVKNPDGKVVTHREFENSLVSPNGGQFLAGVLVGSITVGNWYIELGDTAAAAGIYIGPIQQSGTSNSTCLPSSSETCSYNLQLSGPYLPPPPRHCARGRANAGTHGFRYRALGICFSHRVGPSL